LVIQKYAVRLGAAPQAPGGGQVLQALQAARVDEPERLIEGLYLRLWPHLHGTDGFFAAVWQRR